MDLRDARVVVLAENQYQEIELWYPVLRFREGGADTLVVAPKAAATLLEQAGHPGE